MQCEMCGKEKELVKCFIEGSEMYLCSNCSSFGNIISESKREIGVVKKPIILNVKNNFYEIIKSKREERKLKQEDVAKRLNLKESIIHKIESNIMKPDIKLARKLEKFFKINLIEEYNEDIDLSKNFEDKPRTIGDLLKPKK